MNKIGKAVSEEKDEVSNIFQIVKERKFEGYTGLVIKNSILQTSRTILSRILGLVFTIMMARLLLPELFGLYLRRAGRWSDHISLYIVRNIELAFRPNHEIAEICFTRPANAPQGTSGGTVRRLAEFAGRAPRQTLW